MLLPSGGVSSQSFCLNSSRRCKSINSKMQRELLEGKVEDWPGQNGEFRLQCALGHTTAPASRVPSACLTRDRPGEGRVYALPMIAEVIRREGGMSVIGEC